MRCPLSKAHGLCFEYPSIGGSLAECRSEKAFSLSLLLQAASKTFTFTRKTSISPQFLQASGQDKLP